MKAKNIYKATVVKSHEIAKETIETTFRIEGDFTFVAGQYVWVVLPRLTLDDLRGERRAFSISSAPTKANEISITYRKTKSGFNETLRSLATGDAVEIIGPHGASLCVSEYDGENFIAITAGTGIAPFRSIAEWVVQHPESKKKVTIIHTDRNESSIPYFDFFKKLSEETDTVAFKPHYEKFKWSMLPNNVLSTRPHIFVIGPQGFVNHVYEEFMTNGYEDELLHFEAFYPEHGVQELRALMEIFQTLAKGGVATKEFSDPQEKLLAVLIQGIENSTNHTVITDRNGFVMYANNAAQKTTGFKLTEMYHHTPRLWGGQMSKEFYKELWKSKLSGKVVNAEILNRRKNGEIYSCIAHITPILSRNNTVTGFFAIEQDIEDMKQQNVQLERLNSLMVGRELRMIELKREIKKLKDER